MPRERIQVARHVGAIVLLFAAALLITSIGLLLFGESTEVQTSAPAGAAGVQADAARALRPAEFTNSPPAPNKPTLEADVTR